jgi:hypothetical protein
LELVVSGFAVRRRKEGRGILLGRKTSLDLSGEEDLLPSEEGVAEDIWMKRGGTVDAGRDRMVENKEYLGRNGTWGGGAWVVGAGVDDE